MKTKVFFYSHKGSNRFLANKIANDLNCEIEEIKPRLNSHLLMLMNLNFGNRKIKSKLEDYEKIILCGPIWMGKFIIPLKNFVESNKIILENKNFIFATCCGSTFEKKDEKFGHNIVFKNISNMFNNKNIKCFAFPKVLVLTDDLRNDTDAFMKVNLNEKNFSGEIKTLYNKFISEISDN